MYIDDETVVRETEIAKDDARHIRTRGSDDAEEDGNSGGDSIDIPFRCSFITHTAKSTGVDADCDYIERAADALGVTDNEEKQEFDVSLSRREGPL